LAGLASSRPALPAVTLRPAGPAAARAAAVDRGKLFSTAEPSLVAFCGRARRRTGRAGLATFGRIAGAQPAA